MEEMLHPQLFENNLFYKLAREHFLLTYPKKLNLPDNIKHIQKTVTLE